MKTRSLPETIPAVGTEWLVDAAGCRPERLRDLDALRAVCARLIARLDLRVVDAPLWHQFAGEAGVTGLYLLTESHLACHTYPESGTATFNLYCCRSRPRWPWEDELRDQLGATRVTVRAVARGNSAQPDARKEGRP